MGRPPELKEFGTPAFAGHADVIDADVDRGRWQQYISVIDTLRKKPEETASVAAEDRGPSAAPDTSERQTSTPALPSDAGSPRHPDPLWPPPVLPPQPVQAPVAEEHGSWFRRRRGR